MSSWNGYTQLNFRHPGLIYAPYVLSFELVGTLGNVPILNYGPHTLPSSSPSFSSGNRGEEWLFLTNRLFFQPRKMQMIEYITHKLLRNLLMFPNLHQQHFPNKVFDVANRWVTSSLGQLFQAVRFVKSSIKLTSRTE